MLKFIGFMGETYSTNEKSKLIENLDKSHSFNLNFLSIQIKYKVH